MKFSFCLDFYSLAHAEGIHICCFSEFFQCPVLICTVVDDNGNFEFEVFCERKFVYFNDIQFSITRFFFVLLL